MERHKAKDKHLNTFNLPMNTGKVYIDKTQSAKLTLSKYATHKKNQTLARLIDKGFNSRYVSGVPVETYL